MAGESKQTAAPEEQRAKETLAAGLLIGTVAIATKPFLLLTMHLSWTVFLALCLPVAACGAWAFLRLEGARALAPVQKNKSGWGIFYAVLFLAALVGFRQIDLNSRSRAHGARTSISRP